MVRVKIPIDTPVEDEDGVGIMSHTDESDVDDDIEDPDWEEVKTKDESFPSGLDKISLPENGVTVSFGISRRRTRRSKSKKAGSAEEESEEEDVTVRKRKRTLDLNEVVRKSINKVKITEQLMKHKMSLVLYLARGLSLVKIINCNIIRGLSLSIVDERFKLKIKKGDRKLLQAFMDQFNEVIEISADDDKRAKHQNQPFMVNMIECYASREATSLMELVVMFVACLRAWKPKVPIRILNVLRPITLRADIIPKPSTVNEQSRSSKDTQQNDIPGVVEKLDFWVEVYLEDEKKWCCVDLCNIKLDEPTVLTELSKPFSYLVSYDVDRFCVKAAEKNYCDNWYTPAFKRDRCEDKWWDMLMTSLGPVKQSDRDKADETKIEEILTKKDFPTSDNSFRNHPLYILEKHLLKFQGIYPPEVAPLGFFKEAPIYPRDCVHILRSRETWLRQARTVKLNETPYKIVKARPKRDKYTGDLIRDLPLELFGEWQTEEYDPPWAENGKVPRNCYGNVDMYQECMLPKGCAWLKLPGLPRIANKLGIDCAAAVVGFDNHCGSYGSHPVMDGFIVCEEFADTLRIAWDEEQENARKREEDKRQKRIWDNWKRLIKAAMIREKLRVKYKNS